MQALANVAETLRGAESAEVVMPRSALERSLWWPLAARETRSVSFGRAAADLSFAANPSARVSSP